jgi:hypothetical protein
VVGPERASEEWLVTAGMEDRSTQQVVPAHTCGCGAAPVGTYRHCDDAVASVDRIVRSCDDERTSIMTSQVLVAGATDAIGRPLVGALLTAGYGSRD